MNISYDSLTTKSFYLKVRICSRIDAGLSDPDYLVHLDHIFICVM